MKQKFRLPGKISTLTYGCSGFPKWFSPPRGCERSSRHAAPEKPHKISSLCQYKLICLYGVVWCGVVWCGVVWCGLVWCGVVWYGMVWYGRVWYGMVCIITISVTSPLFFCNGTRFYFWTFVKPFLQWFDTLPENLKRNKCNLQANHQVSTVIKWQLSYNLSVDSITHTHKLWFIYINRIKDGHSSLVHHICCHFGTIPPNPPGFCPVFFQPPFIKTSMIVTKRPCCPVRRPRSTLAYLTSWWKRISTITGPKGAQMIFSSKIGWGLFFCPDGTPRDVRNVY